MQDIQSQEQRLVRSVNLNQLLKQRIAELEALDTQESDDVTALFDRIGQGQQQRREISAPPGYVLVPMEAYNAMLTGRKVNDPWASGLLLGGSTLCILVGLYVSVNSPSTQMMQMNADLQAQQALQNDRALEVAKKALDVQAPPRCKWICF